MRLHRRAELREPLPAARGEVVLVHVRRVEDRLSGQQPELAKELHRRFALSGFPCAAARIELGHDTLEHHQLGLGVLLARARGLARFLETPLRHREVGERQLARDHVVVPNRVHRPHHVYDVGVVEAADHVHHRVHFADVRQELVAEPLTLRRALDEARDVHELDHRRDFLFRLDELVQALEPRIRHLHHADIGLDRAEGVVLRGGCLG